MSTILLSLGTNLGDRPANLGAALAALAEVLTIDALSSVWETAPLLVLDQPPFLNMAVAARGTVDPIALLDRVKAIETALGRVDAGRYGPRLIDIDILAIGAEMIESERLSVPHPRLAERRFALAPLAEVAPDWVHPRLGQTPRALLAALGETQDCLRLGPLETLASGRGGAL
jgi:2-amino-4-hydroxy-6-hydroxymethyldihydropteridine diphosphokinase